MKDVTDEALLIEEPAAPDPIRALHEAFLAARAQTGENKPVSFEALAETVNGYYKSELIYGPARTGPWKTVEDVELATLGWVHWHNTRRLHGFLNDVPPTEFEATFYATKRTDQPLVEIQ